MYRIVYCNAIPIRLMPNDCVPEEVVVVVVMVATVVWGGRVSYLHLCHSHLCVNDVLHIMSEIVHVRNTEMPALH